MRLISSQLTFLFKKVVPALWFGFLGVFTVLAFSSMWRQGRPDLLFLLFMGGMAAFGYLIMRFFIFDFADGVWDEGDALRIRKGKTEFRVPFATITDVENSFMTNPPRVTVHFSPPVDAFTKFVFVPESGGYFSTPEVVSEIQARKEEANQPPETRPTSRPVSA